MFKKIRDRLLLSNLIVFAAILAGFSIVVRVVFVRSFNRQFTDKLVALGQGVTVDAELKTGKLEIDEHWQVRDLAARKGGLQWFDTQGNLLKQQGKYIVNLPLNPNTIVDVQTDEERGIKAVTLPILDNQIQQKIGYVRVSQSLEEFNETIQKLDLGLVSGVVFALILSGIGGLWLNRQAMQPIEESFKRLKQFTADASHELRNPLMAIKSNTAVALKYPQGMRNIDREKFTAIASATNQMTQLTEDLLLLSRTDKVTDNEQKTVNLTSIISNLIQLYQPQAQVKNIDLQVENKNNLLLLGDAKQLSRALGNIIQNAIYYTDSSGKVKVTATRIACFVQVIVRDTGVGIAPENLQLIFERFWRSDQARSYESGGSGLGLAISQAIVQNHGGSITVSSQLNVGSYFTVRLPTYLE
ncbi:HAMP domain-containing sensor histidine kinase [Rivularia sp. UHCC 0363]|uniref:sensor histidine kinase n=1 Tax=Rivularia sp. UHCC 0363 TaxID=3110244 RepID=UPI002B1F7E17|nr:HAMP domain-containing sensor histidine kinase [Rivularia sp. UHCC 0363]MEA5594074.1 HAMP domain-containing sensor histidine kinase [Rivularia sp. UHCC 0363]